MNKIGIIVDGLGDLNALNARFKHGFKILKTDGPRGHTPTIDDIIAKSRKQITMLKGFRCQKAVIMLDFEQRTLDYDKFYRQMNSKIQKYDLGLPVFLAIPNTMIENWFLADIENLSKKKKYIKSRLKQKGYEGRHGKKEIKKCFESKYTYSETKHGPDLFKTIRLQVASKNSSSFNNFLKILKFKE